MPILNKLIFNWMEISRKIWWKKNELSLASIWVITTFGAESWQSGRMRRSWKPLYREVPGVRIPHSPPEKRVLLSKTLFLFARWDENLCSNRNAVELIKLSRNWNSFIIPHSPCVMQSWRLHTRLRKQSFLLPEKKSLAKQGSFFVSIYMSQSQ